MVGLFVFASLLAFSAALPPKIIGGHDADISAVPYQLSLQNNHHHTCGAVLISEKHALTAATCVSSAGNPDFSVRAGSSSYNSGGVVVGVVKIDVHPKWAIESLDNNIAVLTLDDGIVLSDTIAPAKLPSADLQIPVNQVGTLAGWGLVKEGSAQLSETLQEVDMPVLSKVLCRGLFPDEYTDNMICTGRNLGGIGGCNGDSGSGLILNGEVIGIASWSIGCAHPNSPDVDTYVPKYLDFINSITQL